MTIVCLGEALIDLVPPRGERPATTGQLEVQPGGAPLNVSIGLTRLGAEVLFLGCLSNDAFGQRLKVLLRREGVARAPQQSVAGPTRLAVVDQLNSASPFRFYGDATADTLLAAPDVDAVFRDVDASGLYVGSLMMTHTKARAVQTYAIDAAQRQGIPVFSDPNPRPAAWPSRDAMIAATEYLLSVSRVAKLSLDDARALGWPINAHELLRWCAERFQAQLFVSGGAQGCWTMRDGSIEHAAALEVAVADATGAGDASFAALIYQFGLTGSIGEAELTFAAAAGALATQKHGAIAGLPTLDAVRAMLAVTGQ